MAIGVDVQDAGQGIRRRKPQTVIRALRRAERINRNHWLKFKMS